MNTKRVYKKILLEESLREYIFPNIMTFVGVENNQTILTREITKTQWNGLLSFCMRKENIDEMIGFIQEKMERKESPWRKIVTEEGEQSTIGLYIIRQIMEIKDSKLASIIDTTKENINEAFPEENLESIITDKEEKEIVLLQARLFIRTLVKKCTIY